MFGPTNRFYLDINVLMGGNVIEFVDRYRCLGVILDSKLSFRFHIDALSGRIWGALRKIYNGIYFFTVQSKAENGSGTSDVTSDVWPRGNFRNIAYLIY